MAVLHFVLLSVLLGCAVALLPSNRNPIEPFYPTIPSVYLTNINGSVVSTLPLRSQLISEDLLEVSLDFVSQIVGNDVQYAVKSAYLTKRGNVHHAYLRQTVNGLEVFNANLNINTWNKQVLSAGHSFYFGKHTAVGSKSAVEATAAFADYLGITVNPKTLISVPSAETKTQQIISGFPNVKEVKATLGFIILDGGETIESVWELDVDLYNNWFTAHVSAVTLKVVSLHDMVSDLHTYTVYPIGTNDPSDGDRELIVEPAKRDSSPLGWHDQGDGRNYRNTQGNNVYAQENWSGGSQWANNQRPDGGDTLDFNFPIDFTQQPRQYINASTSNLFFWNNIIHDVFYEYGFDEPAGNFQENNLGKGGLGNDAVQANCQDGSGTNNANFATPVDGQRPRMRMYVWNPVTPNLDGDIDNGIIIHEYAHGISNRLTGGPANVGCLGSGEAGGMGEGWGDFFATTLRQREEYTREKIFPMGDYASARPLGIRKFPYTTDLSINPETYGYINNAGYEGVHAKGEVWCGILWEAYWNFRDHHGFSKDWYLGLAGNNRILLDVVLGLKLQPCTPNFVTARDAILAADKVNFEGDNLCRLWTAFAKRGLGVRAIGTGQGVTRVTESFEVPPECLV